MKKIKISSFLFLASLSWGLAANITLNTSGDFSNATNWSGDVVPTSADTAFLTAKTLDVTTSVAPGNILTSSSGGSVASTVNVNSGSTLAVGSNFYVGHAGTSSDVYNQTGGTASAGNAVILNNSPRSAGASSTFNLSGGTFTTPGILTNDGSNNTSATINVSGGSLTVSNSITLGTKTGVTGNTAALNISGGTLNIASLQVGTQTSGTVRVTGNTATINVTSTTLGSVLSDNSNLRFDLASSGVSAINAAGTFQLTSGMDSFIIDGSSFTGIAGSSFNLITAGTLLTAYDFNNITYSGFASGLSGSVAKVGNNVVFTAIAVPEPSTYFMIGAGLLLVGFASFRRRMNVA